MRDGFPPPIVRILHSYLRGRQFAVKVNSELSDLRAGIAGVPQGSVLDPVLFNLFTSDIPKFPNNNIATYADAFYAHSFSQIAALQIPSYERYLSSWKLTANPSKSSVILFTRRTNPVHIPRYPTFFNTPLTATNAVKYLEIVLDKRLTFNNAVNNNAVLRPILTYGMPCWSRAAKHHLQRLQVMQNKCLRLALGADRYTPIRELHRVAQVDMLAEFAAKSATKFYVSTRAHGNPYVAGITTAPPGKHPHIFPDTEELE
ncbi:hypothetical protein Trydic_g11764 [Trypoxylus dichotomus]